MTMISLKVSPELLERIDAEAKLQGITRTALLLRPWLDAEFVNTQLKRQQVQVAPTFQRPAHDPTCRCYICKPPK